MRKRRESWEYTAASLIKIRIFGFTVGVHVNRPSSVNQKRKG